MLVEYNKTNAKKKRRLRLLLLSIGSTHTAFFCNTKRGRDYIPRDSPTEQRLLQYENKKTKKHYLHIFLLYGKIIPRPRGC